MTKKLLPSIYLAVILTCTYPLETPCYGGRNFDLQTQDFDVNANRSLSSALQY